MTVQHPGIFQAYLRAHDLCPLDVALRLRTRYLLVWQIAQGLPICPWELTSILLGLSALTGISYQQWSLQYLGERES